MNAAAELPGLVIPAYQPDPGLVERVRELLREPYPFVVVVDDGSKPACRPVFAELAALERVTVLVHAVNLGKGAALKTALNHVLVHHPEAPGVVAVDADGQHLADDVARVARALAEEPGRLHLGVRSFDGPVPLRSRFGNASSRLTLRLIGGLSLRDTQSGLRGIPRAFMAKLLPLRTSRYEFELEMLMLAGEHGFHVHEIPIQTVYLADNQSSHFDPILDSLRVYWVFLRFLVSSMLTALIDLAVFSVAYAVLGQLLPSVAAGRLVAGTFNFLVNKRVVFKDRGAYAAEAVRYALLVVGLMLVSYQLTLELIERFAAPVVLAKVGVEGFLFLVSFAAQRMYVFASGPRAWLGEGEGEEPTATEWDAYYERPGRLTGITRPITGRRLLHCLGLYRGRFAEAHVLEYGGGNSCFLDAVTETLAPARYTIADNNPTGLELARERLAGRPDVAVLEADVLAPPGFEPPADVCFSVGLIEHFDVEGTRQAIRAHFEAVRPGGLVVLFFPTPTLLYRAVRRLAEALGVWAFPDERPLPIAEVLAEGERHGRLVFRAINWWIVLTQGMLVFTVGEAGEGSSDSRV